MTVSSTVNRVVEDFNGVKTEFDFNFRIFNSSDLKCYEVLKSTGASVLLTEGVDYSVTIDADGTGSVTYTDPRSSLYESLILRVLPLTQSADLPRSDKLSSESIETALDKVVMLVQQQAEEIARALLQPVSSSNTLIAPDADNLGFWYNDGSGTVQLVTQVTNADYAGTISAGVDASKPATPTVNDIYFATDTKIIYVCYSAGVWTDYHSEQAHSFIGSDDTPSSYSGEGNKLLRVNSAEDAVEFIAPINYASQNFLNGGRLVRADTNLFDVHPLSFEYSGQDYFISTAVEDVNVDTAGNYIDGAAAGTEDYIYVYIKQSDLTIKLSVNAPQYSNVYENTDGVLRWKKEGSEWYRCIGVLPMDGAGDILPFTQVKDYVQLHTFKSITTSGANTSAKMPAISRLGQFWIIAEDEGYEAKIRPADSSGDYISDLAESGTNPAIKSRTVVTCTTDDSQQIDTYLEDDSSIQLIGWYNEI